MHLALQVAESKSSKAAEPSCLAYLKRSICQPSPRQLRS